MTEIIFIVEEAPEGGFIARALGDSIVTEADTRKELQTQVRDAVRCRFEHDNMPRVIRLHFAGDTAMTRPYISIESDPANPSFSCHPDPLDYKGPDPPKPPSQFPKRGVLSLVCAFGSFAMCGILPASLHSLILHKVISPKADPGLVRAWDTLFFLVLPTISIFFGIVAVTVGLRKGRIADVRCGIFGIGISVIYLFLYWFLSDFHGPN